MLQMTICELTFFIQDALIERPFFSCILISLHDTNGLLMSDRLGEFCIARTNPFKFEEKTTDSSLPHLIGILDKVGYEVDIMALS